MTGQSGEMPRADILSIDPSSQGVESIAPQPGNAQALGSTALEATTSQSNEQEQPSAPEASDFIEVQGIRLRRPRPVNQSPVPPVGYPDSHLYR